MITLPLGAFKHTNEANRLRLSLRLLLKINININTYKYI